MEVAYDSLSSSLTPRRSAAKGLLAVAAIGTVGVLASGAVLPFILYLLIPAIAGAAAGYVRPRPESPFFDPRPDLTLIEIRAVIRGTVVPALAKALFAVVYVAGFFLFLPRLGVWALLYFLVVPPIVFALFVVLQIGTYVLRSKTSRVP